MTNTPDIITYSSVVTRETVYIVLTMAMLHDVDVKELDLLNAYMMAPNREKTWTVLSPEFWDDS